MVRLASHNEGGTEDGVHEAFDERARCTLTDASARSLARSSRGEQGSILLPPDSEPSGRHEDRRWGHGSHRTPGYSSHSGLLDAPQPIVAVSRGGDVTTVR